MVLSREDAQLLWLGRLVVHLLDRAHVLRIILARHEEFWYLDTPRGLKPDGFSVLRRGYRHASPKALPEPFYIPGGIVVPVQAGATVWASMPADR